MRFRPERSRFAPGRAATVAWVVGVLCAAGAGNRFAMAGDASPIAMAAASKAVTIEQLIQAPPPSTPAGIAELGTAAAPAGVDPRPTGTISPVVAKGDTSLVIGPIPSVGGKPPAKAAPTVEWIPAGTFPYDAATNDLRTALDRFVKSAPGASRYRFASASPIEQRKSIAAFYATHGYAPIWVTDGRWNAAARSVMEAVAQSGDDGLDLADFPLPTAVPSDPVGRLDAELALSNAVAAYAFQARGGRINPTRLSLQIGAKPALVDAASVLDALAGATRDPGRVLQGYNPPQSGYAALRDKLTELRSRLPVAHAPIPSGPALRVGMRDPRVSLIRARFGLSPAADRGGQMIYDTVVASAVADFQRANGLPPSGILTMRTVAALSGPQSSALEKEIIANMERWRWVPRDMGDERVEVNIPDYALKVYRDGSVVHEARVIVGKPDTPTPVFSDRMRYLTVNPAWYVPPSIIQKELMPHAARDPRYLARLGYEVIRRGNTLIVRQPPGDRNALGHVLFMFPNQYAVYLHDTPARGLFGAEKRAFSHGCVRVDQPLKLAETLLGAERGWTEERLRKLLGPREKTISVAGQIPIHLTYFTAGVDGTGDVRLRADIYGYSKRVRTALGLEG